MTDKHYTLTDSESGEQLIVPVLKPTLGPDVLRVTHLYGERGVFTFDPGFAATASCASAITYIDGEAGVLLYRGYPIEQLAELSSFMEVSYLLLHGELPTQEELNGFDKSIRGAHDDQRVVAALLQRLPSQRPSDGHGFWRRRVDVGVLSRQYGHQKSTRPRRLRLPHHREAADHRRGRIQAFARAAVRLPAKPTRILQQPTAHVLCRSVGRVRGESGRRGSAGPAVHSACRPRAKLQHVDGTLGGQLRHEPLLGHRRRHERAMGPGAWRGQ